MHGEYAPETPSQAADLRCRCGRLMARVIRHAVEMKCPRCKRVVMVVDGRPFFPDSPGCRDGDCPCGWPGDRRGTRG